MPRAHRLIATLAVSLTALALWVSPASAESTYNRLLNVYEQTGSIPACSFSSAQLQGVLKSVDTYAAQYFADFTNAISNALAQRASGACSPNHSGAVAVSSSSGNARLALPRLPAATSAGVPLPIVLLAIIGGVALLLAAAAVAMRLTGWEPRWAPAWRQSWDEAEYRITGGWLALVDRLRRRPPRSPGSG